MTSPGLDKAEAVADSLGKQMMKDHARRVRALADGKAKDATITRISSELAASRDREMALERERDELKAEEVEWKEAVQGEYNRAEHHKAKREAAEAEVKRLLEALEPFAAKSRTLHSGYDAGIVAGDNPYVSVPVKHLRAAEIVARALATTGLQGGGDA